MLKLVGANGSPYSRKLRAVLRYRRIPFRWINRGSRDDEGIPPVPVNLIPVLVFPGRDGAPDESAFDTTPLIRRLEALQKDRSVRPTDPALAFLDALVEDFADEWLTKAMFHYRWSYEPDIEKAGRLLPLDQKLDLSPENLQTFQKMISTRQIERLALVGSNPTTGPLIEESYVRLVRLLDERMQRQPFLFGERPSAGDFGLYGQLTQLAQFDPTSAAVTVREAPRVAAWVQHVDDLSGREVSDLDWLPREAAADSLGPLLDEIGRTYAPFLVANAAALTSGAERIECSIDGRSWEQPPFPYQAKCLAALREDRAALGEAQRAWVDATLAGTGCEMLFG